MNPQATSEHVSCVTGPSINSVSVVSAKNNVASSVDVNNNNYNIPDFQNVNSYNDYNVKSTVSHVTSLYAPQPYTTVKSDTSNNISNDVKPTLNGFKHVMEEDSRKIAHTISPSTISTSDSFQSRIKPPSFTVKTSDLNKISTTKVTSTTVKVDESFSSNHVTHNNNNDNNTMSNSFHTPESIKNHNKIDSPEVS